MPGCDDGEAVCDSGETDDLGHGEEERPRFCSLDPPSDIHEPRLSYSQRGRVTYEEFSEACRRGPVRVRNVGAKVLRIIFWVFFRMAHPNRSGLICRLHCLCNVNVHQNT